MAKQRRLPEVLSDGEITSILEQFNRRYPTSHRNRLMITTALETGMRVSELINLRFEDMTLENNAYRLHIKRGKGNRDRVVWLHPDIHREMKVVAEKMGRSGSRHVFTTLKGEPLDTGYLRKMVKAKGERAGVPRLHFHLLRHTALTRLYERTRDIRLVQDVAGHSDPKTTAIYAHISGADIREAMVGRMV